MNASSLWRQWLQLAPAATEPSAGEERVSPYLEKVPPLPDFLFEEDTAETGKAAARQAG